MICVRSATGWGRQRKICEENQKCTARDPRRALIEARTLQRALRGLGPQYALILLGDRSQTLVNEFLHALPAIGFRREDIALGVSRNAMHGVECAGLPSAVPEAGQHFERLAIENVNLLVRAVGEVDVLLLRVLRESNVPHRAVAEGVLVIDMFLDEGPIW